MPLPNPMREVLAVFRPLFTAPTWRKLMTLLTGTLLARGRRTVAAALRASGNDQAGNWSLFHQVLAPLTMVSFSGESPVALAHHRNFCPRWHLCRSGYRGGGAARLVNGDTIETVLSPAARGQ